MTLTFDVQDQTLKMLYLTNGRASWHGTKGMWVDRMFMMLDSHCDLELRFHPWPWPWFFRVNFLNSCISGMGGLIKMETKGTWVERMLYQLCDLELWLWPWILKVKLLKSSIIAIRGWIDMEQKGWESIGCWTQVVTLNFDLTHDLDLGFSRSNF